MSGEMEFAAVVEDVREQRRVEGRSLWEMALNETRFVPGSRGRLTAVSRSGVVLEIAVLDVVEDGDGRVWHVVEKPLAAATEVSGRVGLR